MIGERTARIRTGPLFNLVKEQVAKKNVPEVNPDVARKLAFLEDLKEKTIKKVIDNVAENISFVRSSEEEKTRFKKGITEIVNLVLAEEEKIISRVDRDKIVQDVTNEITGYGPIDPLLDDPEISEIMVNGPKKVYVEKKGRIIETDATFRDDDHVRKIIDKIISPLGRRLDDTSAMVDARLPDGSRVNAVIPPLAVDGPVLTIRKFSKSPLTVDDLIEFGTMSAEVAIFLKACVESRINIMISGGTGSGKTESFLLPLFAQLSKELASWSAPGQKGQHADNWWRGALSAGDIVDTGNGFVLSNEVRQRAHETRPQAMRAMILYPMNALVEDQMTRLRIALDSSPVRQWFNENAA